MLATFKALLSNRNFIMLWCAYGISSMGDNLSEMAILAKLDALNDVVDVTPIQARMTFLLMVPFFLFGPLMGALADRFPRRRIMIVADIARAAIMLAFAALIELGRRTLGSDWGPLAPLAFLGIFAALFAPSRSAMVPMLVRHELLVPANAMISGLGMIATMFALMFGGKLADMGYINEVFLMDAGTFAASACCLFMIVLPREKTSERAKIHREPFVTTMRKGFGYLRAHRRVVELLGLAVVFWFAGATVKSVLPAIVKNAYHGTFETIGRFPALIGLGMAVSSVVVLLLGNTLRSQYAITWGFVGVSGSMTMLAVTTFGLWSPETACAIGAVATFFAGFFGIAIVISYNALLQKIVPDRYRGRVFGILDLTTNGALLLATGLLGIPKWGGIDAWSGYILLAIALLTFVVGMMSLFIRLGRTSSRRLYAFYRNLTQFFAHFQWGFRRIGPCTIPEKGPVIITSNHTCYIDPLLIHCACGYRPISFMIAAEYYNLPVAGHFIKVGECIPVRRSEHDVGAMKEVIRTLRGGSVVGIFIQGGIRGATPGGLKNGVAMFALKTRATVVPAYIGGTRNRGSIVKEFFGRHRARIVFGPPVDLSEFSGTRDKKSLDAASQRIFKAIMALAPKVEPGNDEPTS